MNPSARNLGLNVVRSTGNEEICFCPFHSDTKPSASWNKSKGLFNCFTCVLGLNLVQLSARLGLEPMDSEDGSIVPSPEDYNLMTETERWDIGIKDYHAYFKMRGVCKQTAWVYNLHWNYMEPQAAVLPTTSLRGDIIGAQYRYLVPTDAGTRYKTFGKTAPLWPMCFLQGASTWDTILVTEGAWSAMCIYTWFVNREVSPPLCLALLGAKANQEIIDTLRPFKPFFLYDGDKAGTTACRKMRKLWPSVQAWTVSKSPDDMGPEEIAYIINLIQEKVMV